MNNKQIFDLYANEDVFEEIFEEYDYEIMMARDIATARVLKEISSYLYSAYIGLAKKGKATILLNEDSEYIHISPFLTAEIIDSEKCSFLMPLEDYNLYLKDLKCIRVEGEMYTEKIIRIANTFEYYVLFNNDLTMMIIQHQDKTLIMDLISEWVIDSTFSEGETRAILYTLALVISSFKEVKSNVISLADFKNKK